MTSNIQYIRKRNQEIAEFDISRIKNAVNKAFEAVGIASSDDIPKIVDEVVHDLEIIHNTCWDDYITVETIQDTVEQNLIKYNKYEAAKAYILYREKRANLRKSDIFTKRTNLKPYEYPDLYEYVNAIRFSYWVHTEFNYTWDVQDFQTNVTDSEKTAIKRTMLAIAQVEVTVKAFWGDIYKKLPKPEIAAVGYTFAESEVRHMDAYSHLLEILGLNEEFEKLYEMPVLMERVKYLEGSKETAKSDDNREYSMAVLLFSLFIEHVSLFSQFLIMMSFNKHKNLFKWISNAVEATSKEEHIHGLFGIDLINIIQKEHPEWFDDEYKKRIYSACQQAYDSEKKVLDRILEEGELEFLPKEVILEFIKNRLNNSLQSIGLKKLFDVDENLVEQTEWFEDEIVTTKHNDFFAKRSVNYNKRSKSITTDDLF